MTTTKTRMRFLLLGHAVALDSLQVIGNLAANPLLHDDSMLSACFCKEIMCSEKAAYHWVVWNWRGILPSNRQKRERKVTNNNKLKCVAPSGPHIWHVYMTPRDIFDMRKDRALSRECFLQLCCGSIKYKTVVERTPTVRLPAGLVFL